ncbi:alpha/beta hydrolase fold domain-containing protein [Pseudomaricurvus hydrocarbonicus]
MDSSVTDSAVTEEATQKTLERHAEFIRYVAPALRPGLERRKGYADRPGFSVENLPMLREGGQRYERPFLAQPAVQQKRIPGLAGEPEVTVYVINAGRQGDESRPAILHTHGGGYILGRAQGSVAEMQALAAKHNCVVVSVDYRLAPETPFPGSLHDNYAGLQWLYDNAAELGVDKHRIVLMGDSAGGGHAAMLALEARKRGDIPLRGQVLIYPMLDDRTGSTVPQPEWMGYLSWGPAENVMGWSALLGVPAGSEQVPEGAVPARVKDLSGLPPTFIGVGSIDLFVNEDIEYARRLLNAGVPTELFVVPGGYHGFQAMQPEAEDARRFQDAIDRALERAFVDPAF